ncbi:hypothetical protein PVAND_016138 [Polypedilum vanderplanki]|uniref:Uncharacterized protein n=1 Tax=Polypedilum vanderplanki TaxID=319348 RepID=A0A9J6BE91_POLVA|nr:hypothetical protein PVAND_016138 [Polypedilum vanderplanki]
MEVIDIDIGDDMRYKDTSKKMCSFREKMYCKNARRSITKILVLERGYFNERPVTKVLLLPLTANRRHQLRIHCLEIGHAIVGDYTYGKCLSHLDCSFMLLDLYCQLLWKILDQYKLKIHLLREN